MAAISLLAMLFFWSSLPLLSSAEDQNNCQPFLCGKLGELGFPFYDATDLGCYGLYKLDCRDAENPKIELKDRGYLYDVENISQASTVTIKIDHHQLLGLMNSCDLTAIESFALPFPSLVSNLTTDNSMLTLLKCNHSVVGGALVPRHFQSTKQCGDYDVFFYYDDPNISSSLEGQHYCSVFRVPRLDAVTLEVRINPKCYECHAERGKCLADIEKHEFHCSETTTRTARNRFAVMITIGVTLPGIAIIFLLLCFFSRKKFPSSRLIFFSKKKSPLDKSIEAFLRSCGPLQARRYSYSDIKKMTNTFKEKLGQGGFGSVYKGKLHDDHLVAVKILKESKGNGEDFVNEVTSISRTSHVNIVPLLGFTFEGSKKALVYEFMSNGSLEKFVFHENSPENSRDLDWDTHYEISLGIARGLEYLHRGCNARILHFDIKPHNILLDAGFVPKISDFGLAKICGGNESLVSMTVPRGTVGYIAPEVFSRNFGGVSHKSDVYSYGMMILEMVGGRKNINIRVDNTSEIYFPHWIYKRLEVNEELGLKRVASEEDRAKVRKMVITSLWCIQTDPSSRPAMRKVIEMLEGSLDSLQVPPKPFY